MREEENQGTLSSERVCADQHCALPDHPLAKLRPAVDAVVRELTELLEAMYAGVEHPAIPPQKLLRAALLRLLYSFRTERILLEQLRYNGLFRWFVGLTVDDEMWHPTAYSKGSEELLQAGIAQLFFERVLAQADQAALLSDQYFAPDWPRINESTRQEGLERKVGLEMSGDDSIKPGARLKPGKLNDATGQLIDEPEDWIWRTC
jgi:transposase